MKGKGSGSGGGKGKDMNRGSNKQKLPSQKANAGRVGGSTPPGSNAKSTR